MDERQRVATNEWVGGVGGKRTDEERKLCCGNDGGNERDVKSGGKEAIKTKKLEVLLLFPSEKDKQ